MKRVKTLVTPEVAKHFLKHNLSENRKIRALAVNKIAQDIIDGRWDPELSNYQDPILIAEDGTMINGQHRCMGVIKAGIPVEIYVVYGVPKNIYKFLDGGTPRTVADLIDVPNRKNVAALARIACAIEDGNTPLASALQGKIEPRTQATRAQVIEKVNAKNEQLQKNVRDGQRLGIYLFNRKTFISTAMFLIDFTGRGDVAERFVYEGSQLTTESQQINALRAYVGKCISNKNYKIDSKFIVSCVLYAYEAFRDNHEIRTFNSNKVNAIFSKYDKLIFDERKQRNELHGRSGA